MPFWRHVSEMISYSREQLISWRPAAPTIAKRTRKRLFTLRLWLPRYARGVHTCRTRRQVPVSGRRRLLPRQLTLGSLNACSIRRKSAVLTDVLATYDLDLFALTESWREDTDDLSVGWSVRPAGYCTLDVPRSSSAVAMYSCIRMAWLPRDWSSPSRRPPSSYLVLLSRLVAHHSSSWLPIGLQKQS